ncbi:hypothetical protein DPMN_020812 [Dreissena polymorpha]|uniref:Uncharacterized protein n=1 Tax=Dreissena polymorpha TaxID=45954 RepID=A0A9D4NMT0_DREPO|nr:hypothetical protein DPMN_020812 [Dreissena polymorpha]
MAKVWKLVANMGIVKKVSPSPTRNNFWIADRTFRLGVIAVCALSTASNVQNSRAIVRTHVLIKFHKGWKINVTFRVKNALHPGGHVFFLSNRSYFELVQNNIETHVLTKFHEYWTKYVASRVLTKFHEDWTTYVASRVFTR